MCFCHSDIHNIQRIQLVVSVTVGISCRINVGSSKPVRSVGYNSEPHRTVAERFDVAELRYQSHYLTASKRIPADVWLSSLLWSLSESPAGAIHENLGLLYLTWKFPEFAGPIIRAPPALQRSRAELQMCVKHRPNTLGNTHRLQVLAAHPQFHASKRPIQQSNFNVWCSIIFTTHLH